MSDFAQDVILITGAASGIGRELTRQLLQVGARVAAVDCQEEALQALQMECADLQFAWAAADVTNRTALFQATRQLEERFGPFDRLITCAGIGKATRADAFASEEFEAEVRVNLIGVANSIEAVLPAMIQRRKGHLVALSSLASFRGIPRLAGYSASKAGVNALMDSLSVELKPYGISVSTICPGWVRTPMTAPIAAQMRRMLNVEEAAQRILHAVRRRQRFHAFPTRDSLVMRLLRMLPPTVGDWFMSRKKLPKVEAPAPV
ncbi:MAG TPA: SDR family NAD(P)-dependent oxidoreductase [Gemmataceae bacterium]|jgi:short-subunit dehydrogenase|nr:SDR family NAD(P)-dependent oxidoreductase [Gemmataceae bacterium]